MESKKLAASLGVVLVAIGASHAQEVTVTPIRTFDRTPSLGKVLVNPTTGGTLQSGLFVALQRSTTFIDLEGGALNDTLVDALPMWNGRFAHDSFGGLYRSGSTQAGNDTTWSIRRSVDGGVNWETIMPDWQWVPGKSADALGIAADAAGNLFACGYAFDGKGQRPVIRASGDDGQTWQTSILSQRSDNFSTAADVEFVAATPSHEGGVFVVGRVGNNWTVWRWSSANNSWPVIRSWAPAKGVAEATAIASDDSGRIYVGGMERKLNATRNWAVWRSDDGGVTWADMANNLGYATDNVVRDLEVDADGNNLWVVGSSLSVTDGTRTSPSIRTESWAMQRWTPAGWNLPVSYSIPGTISRAFGVATAPSTGKFYVTGNLADSVGQTHGTVLEISN